jgi:transcription elongation factor GreB
MKASAGDRVVVHAPAGNEQIEIVDVEYGLIAVEPFREPPGAESAPSAS